MKKLGGGQYLPARVPGSVYSDLLQNRQMEDPFWRDNEDAAFALLEGDYEYRTEFSVPQKLLNMDRVLLRCEGLDTLAEISLNNKPIAHTDNMHRTWEFDVSKILKKEKNELKIIFRSPIKFAAQADKKIKVDGSSDALDGFPQLRKAHCMFGWDWGPRLPDAGIWRDISLVGLRMARIDSVYIRQKHKKDSVELDISVEIDSATDLPKGPKGSQNTDYSWKLIVTDPKGKSKEFSGSPMLSGTGKQNAKIEKPELWWPNGFGSQILY
ncbi:MAG: glycoside hydrolase family 2 protein, partial [Treponema sp.]|nr:glycoside hydrolase family 2 protein [Treponema sp.]